MSEFSDETIRKMIEGHQAEIRRLQALLKDTYSAVYVPPKKRTKAEKKEEIRRILHGNKYK